MLKCVQDASKMRYPKHDIDYLPEQKLAIV